jgi:ubiquinone biosynthesis protein
VLGATGRLIAAGVDAAPPRRPASRELTPHLPPAARPVAALAHLFAGRKARQGRPGERLARAFERLGPVAIKLGQLLATRADVFGETMAADLAHLKDRLPPFEVEAALREIEASLRRPPGTVFATVHEAVAAASIAQAHRATLLDGREVAVKVLRPGVERRVAADIRAMRLGAGLVEALVPPARRLEPRALVATVAPFAPARAGPADGGGGGGGARGVMARDGYMRAPEPVWEATGPRVLTLGWAEGVALSDPASLEQAGLDRPALANNVIRGFLAQALEHGAFHADLHEGNLFVAAPDRVTAIDFGIVGRLTPFDRRIFAEVLWGFLRRDYQRVAEVHFEAGYVPASHDVGLFAQALRAVGEPIFGKDAREVGMGALLTQLFETTARFDMHLRPELVLLQKTMVTVEGVARRIDPAHDIWAAARPVVERYVLRELGPAARARRLADEVGRAVQGLARLAEAPEPVAVIERRDGRGLAWAALALAAVALGAAAAALLGSP